MTIDLLQIKYDYGAGTGDYEPFNIDEEIDNIFNNSKYYYYECLGSKIKPFFNVYNVNENELFTIIHKFIGYLNECGIMFNKYIVLKDFDNPDNYRIIFKGYNVDINRWRDVMNDYMLNEYHINIAFDFTDDELLNGYCIPTFINHDHDLIEGPSFELIYYINDYNTLATTESIFNRNDLSITDLFISYIDDTKYIKIRDYMYQSI